MASLGSLTTYLVGNASGLKRTLVLTTGQINNYVSDVGKESGRFNSYMSSMAMAMATTASASVYLFGSFEQGLRHATSILEDFSKASEKALGDMLLSNAYKSVKSLDEQTGALYAMSSAGMNASEQMRKFNLVQDFSVASSIKMGKSLGYLIDIQNSFGMKSQNAAKDLENMRKVADTLVNSNRIANATTIDFAQALTRRFAVALRLVNKDLAEGVGVLTAFAKQGIKGRLAGRTAAMMLRDLQKASVKNTATWRDFGIKVYDAEGKMRSISSIMRDMTKALSGMSDKEKTASLAMLGMTFRSQQATMALLGMSDIIDDATKKAGIQGTVAKVAESRTDTLASTYLKASHAVASFSVTLGEFLTKSLSIRAVLAFVVDSVNKFREMLQGLDTTTGRFLVKLTVWIAVAKALKSAFTMMFGVMSRFKAIAGVKAGEKAETASALSTTAVMKGKLSTVRALNNQYTSYIKKLATANGIYGRMATNIEYLHTGLLKIKSSTASIESLLVALKASMDAIKEYIKTFSTDIAGVADSMSLLAVSIKSSAEYMFLFRKSIGRFPIKTFVGAIDALKRSLRGLDQKLAKTGIALQAFGLNKKTINAIMASALINPLDTKNSFVPLAKAAKDKSVKIAQPSPGLNILTNNKNTALLSSQASVTYENATATRKFSKELKTAGSQQIAFNNVVRNTKTTFMQSVRGMGFFNSALSVTSTAFMGFSAGAATAKLRLESLLDVFFDKKLSGTTRIGDLLEEWTLKANIGIGHQAQLATAIGNSAEKASDTVSAFSKMYRVGKKMAKMMSSGDEQTSFIKELLKRRNMLRNVADMTEEQRKTALRQMQDLLNRYSELAKAAENEGKKEKEAEVKRINNLKALVDLKKAYREMKNSFVSSEDLYQKRLTERNSLMRISTGELDKQNKELLKTKGISATIALLMQKISSGVGNYSKEFLYNMKKIIEIQKKLKDPLEAHQKTRQKVMTTLKSAYNKYLGSILSPEKKRAALLKYQAELIDKINKATNEGRSKATLLQNLMTVNKDLMGNSKARSVQSTERQVATSMETGSLESYNLLVKSSVKKDNIVVKAIDKVTNEAKFIAKHIKEINQYNRKANRVEAGVM